MAGKIKLKSKPYNPAKDSAPALHDRRAAAKDLPLPGEYAVTEVIDPMGLNPGDKVVVTRQLRDDPLGSLHSRGHIDEAQYQGGRSYQRYFEQASSSVQAIDYGKAKVDGGITPEGGASERQVEAVEQLGKGNAALGVEGIMIVEQVIIRGFSMEMVANAHGLSGKSWIEYFGKRFRRCLETLAKVYGHTNKICHVPDIVE